MGAGHPERGWDIRYEEESIENEKNEEKSKESSCERSNSGNLDYSLCIGVWFYWSSKHADFLAQSIWKDTVLYNLRIWPSHTGQQ